MASNEAPREYDQIVEILEDAADGAHTYEVAVGLEQNKEADIRVDLVALAGAAAGPGGVPPAIPGAKATYNVAKTQRTAKNGVLRDVSLAGQRLARTCVSTLRNVLGQTWNSAWNAAGFTEGSLAIPANPMALLQQLRAYYLANPTHEGTVAGVACTAAACEQMAQDISTAQSDANQAQTDAATARLELDEAIADGRRRITGLREELAQLIDDDDERWYAFGFNRPSDPETPEVPAGFTVTAGVPGSHMLLVDWDESRRAEGYRVRMINMADGSLLVNALIQDSEYTATGLPAGVTMRTTVTARNDAGESVESVALEVVVP